VADPVPHIVDQIRRCSELRDRAVSLEYDSRARTDAAMHLAYEVGGLLESVLTLYAAHLRDVEVSRG